jgi:hypothetical protein
LIGPGVEVWFRQGVERPAMAGAAVERKVIKVLLVEDEEIHRVRVRSARPRENLMFYVRWSLVRPACNAC